MHMELRAPGCAEVAMLAVARSAMKAPHRFDEASIRTRETTRAYMQLLGRRWTLDILTALSDGPLRRSALRARLEASSQEAVTDKILTASLRALCRHRLVHRRVIATVPITVIYGLTENVGDLWGAMAEFGLWVSALCPNEDSAALGHLD